MKKPLVCACLAFALPALFAPAARGCSVFSVEAGETRVMARNFDWSDGAGYLLYSGPGVKRQAEGGLAWRSLLATLTFHLETQESSNYSIGGVNEKGLAIEAVWLKEADYGQATGPELTETEWITYNLDNFATVDEVLAAAPSLPIRKKHEPLHYMGCDPSGCFTLEYLAGALQIHSGGALPYAALTNVAYRKGVAALPSFKGFGGDRDPSGPSPSARFARASYFLTTTPAPALGQVLAALDSLRIPSGPVATKWSYIYDLPAKTITFDTGRSFSLSVITTQHPGPVQTKLPLPY